jgi:hypothetical protein
MGIVVNLERTAPMPESKTLTRLNAFPNIERIKTLPDTECAWLAGFFDGEGSIGLYRKFKEGKFYAVSTRITVAQTDRTCLDTFFNLFGGSLVLIDRPERKTIRHTQYWSWTCDSTASANLFLQTVRKFLRVKAEEADLVMEFIAHRYDYPLERKGMLIDQLAALKTKRKSHLDDDSAQQVLEYRAKIDSIRTGTDE